MKRLSAFLAALVLFTSGVNQAKAGPISGGAGPGGSGDPTGADPGFWLTYSDISGNVATAHLDAIDMGGGQFLVTSGTLNVTGGGAVGTYSLEPGGPAVFTSTLGAFFYDNVLYPAFPVTDPFLDTNGLVFSDGATEINIWGNGPGNYSFYAGTGPGSYFSTFDGGSATLTAVPEPASMTMLGLGVAGLLGYRMRRRVAASVA